MSAFDPKTFGQMTFNQANSTKSTPVPVGEQPGTCYKWEVLPWASREDPQNKNGLKMNVLFNIDGEAVKEITKRDQNLVRYEFFLDLTPEGMLDMGEGKNVKLGRLREALNLNTPGTPFSFDMMLGRRALCSIQHRIVGEDPVADIKAVARIA